MIKVSHGGSRRGNGQIVPWAEDCLVKLDLEAGAPKEFRKCAKNLEDKDGSPHFILGTLFHAYMEQYLLTGNLDKLEFEDEECGYVASDIQAEAWRLFSFFKKTEAFKDIGEAVAVEMSLDGPFMKETFGVDVTGRIDAIVRKPDGRLVIVDWKTASASYAGDRNKYMYRDSYFQRVIYTHGAKALGYDIADFEFWQVIKTKKEPKVFVHRDAPISESELAQVRRYLQFAEHRKESYPREFLLGKCSDCAFNYNGQCKKGI